VSISWISRSVGVNPTTIALGFNEQIIQDIPVNELDVTVDKVLFEKVSHWNYHQDLCLLAQDLKAHFERSNMKQLTPQKVLLGLTLESSKYLHA
jgi:hypothetical protein